MDTRKATAFVIGALVLGLVLGNVGSGFAATDTATTTTATAQGPLGMGMRLGGAMRDAGGRLIDVVAKLTGLSTEELAAKRAEGASFSEIAKAEGVTQDAVVDEALKVRKAALDAKVADGTITQAQADTALAAMETRLTERVQSATACDGAGAMGGGRGGRGMGGGGGMGRGAGTGGCGGACTTAPAAQ